MQKNIPPFRFYNYYGKFAQKRVSANSDNTSYTIGPDGVEVYDGEPEVLWQQVVFVKDARIQWTHGYISSFVGSSYIWLSKTLIPVRREVSAWAENGVDPTATIDTQYVTIEAKVFYEMEEEVIKRIEPRTTPGIHNVSITYSDDRKTAYISFGIDGVDVSANTDVPFVFFSEHLGNSGRTTIVTIVPTADGKDGDRGDVGVGIGLVNEEYLANDGTTPSKADSGFATSALAGFGPDKPFLWRRLSIYSTESLLINDPEWNFVGHFAVNGRDIQAEYSEDGIHWTSYHEGCIYMRIMKADGTWSDPFLIVGEDGLDGPHTDFSFGISQHATAVEPNNALSGPSDIADSDWTDGPQAVTKEKPYLWMRSLRWELDHTTRKLVCEKYTNGTPKYYYTRLTGEAGVSPLIVDLSNEMTSVPVDLTNHIVGEKTIQLELHAFVGTKEQTITRVEMVAKPGFTLRTTSNVNKPQLIIADGTELADTTDIELRAYIGTEYRTAIFSVAAVKSHNGKDAEIYELAPRKSSLSFARDDNNALTPAQLKEEVRIKYVKGDTTAVFGVNDPQVSHLKAKYGFTDDESAHTDYNPSTQIVVTAQDVTDNGYDTLYLSLWDGSKLIDRESIPILKDGAKGEDGTDGVSPVVVDLDNEMTSIPVGPNGEVTREGGIKIDLSIHAFLGITPIQITEVSCANAPTYATFASNITTPTTNAKPSITFAKGAIVTNEVTDFVISVKLSTNETRTVTFTVAAVKSVNGKDATLFELAPRKSSLSFARDNNNALTPAQLKEEVRIKWIEGEQSAVVGVSDTKVARLKVKFGFSDDESTHNDYNPSTQIVVTAQDVTDNGYDTLYLSLWDGSTLIDRESIPILKDGQNGEDGKSPIVVDLDNEMTSIPVGQNGEVTKEGGFELELSIKAYLGTTAFKIKSVSCTPPSYATFTPNVDAASPTTNAKPRIKFAKGVVPAEVTDFEISVVLENDETRTVTYTVAAVKSGGKGENATIQELLPSPTQISFYRDANNNLAPASRTVSLKIKDVDGNTVREKEVSQTTLVVRYSFTEMPSSKTAGSSWNGSLNVTNEDAKTYSNLYIAAFNQSDVLIDRETLPIIKDGQDGKDGESPVVVDLENEMTSVPVGEDGSITKNISLGLKLHAFVGTKVATITAAVCEGYSSGNIVFSANNPAEPTITFSRGFTPTEEIIEFPIAVSVQGFTGTRTVTYTVAFVKSGGKGEDAILYELFPYPNALVFARNDDGSLSAVQNYIDILLKRTEGSNITTPGVGTFKVRYKLNGFPTSATSDNALPANSRISLTTTQAESTSTIGLALYTEGGTLIDKETIPVLKDGKNGEDGEDGKDAVTLDIDNEMDSIPCDVSGKPTKAASITTNVRLYEGATAKSLTTGVTAAALCGATASIAYSGGVATVTWSIPTTNALDGRYTSTIKCVYGGVTYEATFTLVAVRAGLDGTSPTIYQVLPSLAAISFACVDGENYTPNSISITCGYTKQVGDEAITSVANQTSQIDSLYDIYYRIVTGSSNGTWTKYTAALTVANNTTATRYDFCLAKGAPTTATNIIDIEGVPVVRDGKRGERGEDGKDGAGAVQPNLFGVDSIVKDSDANTAALHTDTGLYIYRSSSAGTNSCTIIDDISEGTFYVQCNGSAVIGYYSGSSFVSATNKTANGITSANVTISGSQRIAIKVSGSVTLSDIKIEEGAGLTAPTAYCRKRTLNVKAIQDSLFSDTWNANSGVSNATTANSYKQKYTTYVLTSTGVLSQTVSNLVAGKRYCISFYTYGTANVTATITNHRTAYYCNLSSTKYGEMSNNQVIFTAASSSFKLCKIVFVANSTTSAISFRGACRLSLLKIEEGEDRTLSRDEVNIRDLSALSNSEIDQVKVSYEASSMSASAGVASATKLEVSTSAMTITSPGVVVLKDTDTNVAIDVSSFKDGDVLRLICNSKTITNDDAKRVVVPMGADSGLLKDEVTPIAILDSDPNDTELKDDFSLTGHLHKITLSSAGKFEGIGSLIVNSQDDVASERIALSGSRTIHFAGGILEFVYLAGTMWMRMANAIDFFVDYPSLNETVNYNVDKSSGVPFTAKRIIDRKYFGERIQYIFVKQ